MQICIVGKKVMDGGGGIIQDYACKRCLKIDPKQEFTKLLLTIILFWKVHIFFCPFTLKQQKWLSTFEEESNTTTKKSNTIVIRRAPSLKCQIRLVVTVSWVLNDCNVNLLQEIALNELSESKVSYCAFIHWKSTVWIQFTVGDR